jgi:type I restriction enzyme S subunit
MALTSLKNVINLKFNLAPSQLEVLDIPNKTTISIAELLDRKLKNSDKGIEIGSINYVRNSSHFFMRAKSLQFEYFIPFLDTDTIVPIRPQVFVDYKLKKGDLIISKDSNIGECILLDDDYPNYMLSSALYKLPITKNKYYLFAFLKHQYFRNQLDILVPKGSTIRHAKTLFLDCVIPFPNQKNKEDVINYVEMLVKLILNKEIMIKYKNKNIIDEIYSELIKNQKNRYFNYNYPRFKILKNNNRLDAGVYSEYLCKNEYLIKNYKHGYSNIKQLGFNASRGQNLQISCIGSSIYSDEYHDGFYTVIKPMHISVFGTDYSREYLGNQKILKTLNIGDVVFGAEGFQKGRSLVIIDEKIKTITNIHGITLHHKNKNNILSIFVKCFLDYLRNIGLIDLFAVGGNGGSLAMKYLDIIPIPLFSEEKQKEISKLYHNNVKYPSNISLENLLVSDQRWNQKSGIVDIDKSIKIIRNQLNMVLNRIINNQKVEIEFDFINEI